MNELIHFQTGKCTFESPCGFHYGKLSKNKGYYYPNLGVNLFSSKEKKIPEDAIPLKINKKFVKEFVLDPTRTHIVPLTDKPKGKMYFIHDNGSRPFVVYINKDTIIICSKDDPRYYIWDQDYDKYNEEIWRLYTNKVVDIKNYLKLWIGDSDCKKYDHPCGSWATGNSILIQISPQIYIFVGQDIYKFRSRSQIIKYHSIVGPNDVPYPVAESEDRYYFMLDNFYLNKKDSTLR